MKLSKSIGLNIECVSMACLYVALAAPLRAVAQEPSSGMQPAPAAGRGAQGNGGRGNSTREFLGLGPAPDAAAAKLGEPLYKENCAGCHGENARGAQGPNLVRSPLVLHDEKGEGIGAVVKSGRPQEGMPAFTSLSETQIYDIAEYVHLQIELAANRGTYSQTYRKTEIAGDLQKGNAFFAANCTSCHSATGDLAKIGTKYAQPSSLMGRIAWPSSPQLNQGTVTTASGEKISGRLVTFDDFVVAMRDGDGVYREWPRSQVQVDLPDKLAGHRALLPRYTDADLHNLTRYLGSLK